MQKISSFYKNNLLKFEKFQVVLHQVGSRNFQAFLSKATNFAKFYSSFMKRIGWQNFSIATIQAIKR